MSQVQQPNLQPVENSTELLGASVSVAAGENVPQEAGIDDSWDKFKKLLGFTPRCLNGGTRNLRGNCQCPKFFNGTQCEQILCANNGTRVRLTQLVPLEYACKCPYPDYIYGKHCELVQCMNGGHDIGNGHCHCLDYWYTGQFCQHYTASWGAVLGAPIILLAVVIICCVVCRMDLCPRKTRNRHHSRPRSQEACHHHRYRIESRNRMRPLPNQDRNNVALMHILQENDRNEAFDDHLRHTIIHLNTIPVFNPALLAGDDLKPLEPPPTYDQAVSSGIAVSGGQQAQQPTTNPPPPFQSVDPNIGRLQHPT